MLGLYDAERKDHGLQGFPVNLFVLIRVVKPQLFKAAETPAIQ